MLTFHYSDYSSEATVELYLQRTPVVAVSPSTVSIISEMKRAISVIESRSVLLSVEMQLI
jgi:hypothetical protein